MKNQYVITLINYQNFIKFLNNIVATSGAILHIDNISINRANEPQTIFEGIDISTKSAATEAATVIADAKKQIKFRN